MKDVLLMLAALNALLALPMALLVKRDFARLGRVSRFMAVWTGAAMHGNALVTMALAWIDRGSLGAIGIETLVLGGPIAASGVVIIALGRRAYASFARVYGLKEDELIEHGVYRWSRNPQYVGYALFLFGAAVMGASASALGLSLIFAVFIHFYIVSVEEPHLKQAFGDKYFAYMRRVPRYLGLPRPARRETARP